jgi:hypothetical protein
MDNKVIIIVVVAILLVVAGIVVVITMNGSSNDVPSDSVRYMGNGGSLESGATYYDYRSTEVAGCLFTNNGSHFTVWNTKSDGSGTEFSVGSVVSLNTVLYAVWSDNNTIGSINMYSDVFNLYVAKKGDTNLVNIDRSSADIAPKDAILVLVAKEGSQVSIDDSNKVVIKYGKDTYRVTLSIPVQGLSLGVPSILADSPPSAYYDINQSVKNQGATLSMSVVKTTSS